MATNIKLKKSAVAGKVPLSIDLEYGELAINYSDGRLYYKTDTNVIDYFKSGSLDSADTINLIDSAYVQARQLKSHAIGGKYRFDTSTTAGDPGSGDIRFSIDWTTGTEGSSYYAYVSETDKDGIGIAPLLDQLTVSTSTNKALVIIYKADEPTTNAKFYVTGQTDNGSYRTLDITYVDRDAWGEISNGDEIFMSLSIVGDTGDISGAGLDSADVISLIDSNYIQARIDQTYINSLDVNAGTLDGQDGTYFLDYNNFTNTPTIPDSAFVSGIAATTVGPTDSASITAIVDSAFVQNLVTEGYIATLVDSAYVALRVGDFADNFGTVAVVGDLSIDATTGGDTVTFEGGTGVDISTNVATKRITISATPSTVYDFGTISAPVQFTLDMGAI